MMNGGDETFSGSTSVADEAEELTKLVRENYASYSEADQALIVKAVVELESRLKTEYISPKDWEICLELFEAAAAKVSQPEEIEMMQSCAEKARKAVKEHAGGGGAAENQALVDPTPLLGAESNCTVVEGASADKQTPVNSKSFLVAESNGKVDDAEALESAEVATAQDRENGVSEVQNGEPVISGDWNSAPVNCGTAGWTSAEPPPGLENGTTFGEVAATPDSGVLGSATPASKAVEHPPQQVYSYYMVKIPRPRDQPDRTLITSAEQQLQDKTDARNAHNSTVQAVKAKRIEALERRKALKNAELDCLALVRKKFEEMRPLLDNLKRLKDASRVVREKSRDMPMSEEELDHRIASLEWRIQHESIPLKEEKQLMRDIKALQASREAVRANAALYAQVHESLGQRQEIEDALKPLDAEYKKLELELKTATEQRKEADGEVDQMTKQLEAVQGQLMTTNEKRQEAYEHRKSLKEQGYLRMKHFYDNKREVQQAKMLASRPNNSKAVEAYCNAQVERLLELWNKNDEFRTNYVKDNEWSTVRRLGTLDGRSLGPDEQRPVLSSHSDLTSSTKPASQQNGIRAGGAVKEATPPSAEKVEAVPVLTPVTQEKPVVKRETREPREIPNEPVVKPPVVEEKSQEELEKEAAELKEKRRVTEMTKAKEAEERKRRVAERSQAKALAWAQREAERKEREKEKKARKKSGVTFTESPSLSETAPAAESMESVAEVRAPGLEETKVSSRQRKRGVTNASKRQAKVAGGNVPLPPPTRARQQKVLGISMQVLVGFGAVLGIAVLIAVVYIAVGKLQGGNMKEGMGFKGRPDVSSQSFAHH